MVCNKNERRIYVYNTRENEKLIQLRDTLLPKLMSGEIDVSEVDISTDKLSFSLQISLVFYKLDNKSCFYINKITDSLIFPFKLLLILKYRHSI